MRSSCVRNGHAAQHAWSPLGELPFATDVGGETTKFPAGKRANCPPHQTRKGLQRGSSCCVAHNPVLVAPCRSGKGRSGKGGTVRTAPGVSHTPNLPSLQRLGRFAPEKFDHACYDAFAKSSSEACERATAVGFEADGVITRMRPKCSLAAKSSSTCSAGACCAIRARLAARRRRVLATCRAAGRRGH
jgi:hypothetical protein